MSSLQERINFVANEMRNFPEVVHIGFSGGKDSSAVVKILLNALGTLNGQGPRVEIVYCDTGVENPVVDRFVKRTLRKITKECRLANIAVRTRIIQPQTHQSFFVRIIGRGYPPPTNTFRWCTTDIRIRPFQHFLRNQKSRTLIAIGTRIGESAQRDRSLKKASISPTNLEFYQRQRDGFPGATLFTPIIDFSVEDVWNSLIDLEFPKAIDVGVLTQLYKDGGGECPAIRDFQDKPCSRARFGCWTCTVVRRDKSSENMITQGHHELEPFLEFREWLSKIRNVPDHRCRLRRSGKDGPGPFTLKARKMLLARLTALEARTKKILLTTQQRAEIARLWRLDRESDTYAPIE
jgi:DNA sulfur modification protein DndC